MKKNSLPNFKPSPSTQEILNKLIPNQCSFLEKYPLFSHIEYTCRAIGIGKHNFYSWMRDCPDFLDAWNLIKKEAQQARLQLYEDNLHEIAFDKEVPAQTRAISSMFVIKKLDPSYRDNAPVQPGYQDNRTINITVSSKEVAEGLQDVWGERKQLTEGKKEGDNAV